MRLERFCEHIARAGRIRADLIDRLECAGQQDHGNVGKLRPAFYIRCHFITIALGHIDVSQHDVKMIGIQALNRELPVADRRDFDVLVGKSELDDALNRDTVIC